MTDSREDTICEGQYGEWLRASLPRGVRKGSYGESVARTQVDLRQNQNKKEGTSKKVIGDGIWEQRNIKEGAIVVRSKVVGKEQNLQDTTLKETKDLRGKVSGVGIKIRDYEGVGDNTKTIMQAGDEKGLGRTKEIEEAVNDGPEREMMEVVNVLNSEEMFQGVLGEVDQNIMWHMSEIREEVGMERAGQWKRQIRSGGREQRGERMSIKVDKDQNGKRKAIQEVGTKMIELDQTGIGKRQKTLNKENDITQAEVEVASREWPQTNK